MHTSRPIRMAAILVLFAGLACAPARAVNKDMIQLQTQVQELQDAVARLQQSNDERMGVLKDLVQQTSDAINKMSITVNGLKLGMQNEQDAATTRDQQLSGQIQSLNDSVDELKARMAKMETALGNIQNQQASTNAALSNLPQAGGGIPAGVPAGAATSPAPATANSAPVAAADAPATAAPAANSPAPAGTDLMPATAATPQAAPRATASAGELYRGAYGDYMSAKYALAASEFGDLIKAYPDDNLSGNAYFYRGEIDMRSQKPSAAIKNYDAVLERYPDNAKVPAAHLHKAYALLDMKQTAAGERELHALIARFPVSPEASQARAKLSSLNRGR
ncbi:MAG: transporter [Acidobacteria bacterium]|nr:transporter [Acidobacteriota bacterium]